jgi:hypothetical protein
MTPRAPIACAFDIEEFHAYLLPSYNYGNPGDSLRITFEVDSTAKHFNGYEITIEWDPDIVSLMTVEEGALMENACVKRWFDWETTDSTVVCTHILLCEQVSVDGPGVLSTYEFYGIDTGLTPLEITTDPNRAFFDDGLYIWPGHPAYPRQVILHDSQIYIEGHP